MKKRPILWLVSLLGPVLVLTMLLSFSACAKKEPVPTATPVPTPTATPAPTPEMIAFESGAAYPVAGTTEVKTALTADELPLLDRFLSLSRVDATGSTCYAELAAYRDAHPNVQVVYTVQLTDTVAVDPMAESAVLSGTVAVNDLIANLAHLSKLTTLDVRAVSLPTADAALLLDACPDVEIAYALRVGGLTVESTATELDITKMPLTDLDALCDALPLLHELTYVNLSNADGYAAADGEDLTSTRGGSTVGDGLDWSELAKLYDAAPTARFDYKFTLFGETYTTACESIDLKKQKLKDAQVDTLMAIAPYLCCGMVDMEGCGVDNETMAALNAAMPRSKAVWRVALGHGASARTDAKRIRLVKDGVKYNDKNAATLKYCTEVELLDLGHNKLKDISFVKNMPNLRVAILAINYIEDISPIASCENLEYLELFSCMIEDLSPLANLTNLRHLNLNWNRFEDVTPLYNLTGLERLWLGRNDLTEQQQAELQAALPNTVLNYDRSATGDGWRNGHPRYEQLREEFNYEHPKNGGY